MIASFSASNQVGELMKKEMKRSQIEDHKIENHNSTDHSEIGIKKNKKIKRGLVPLLPSFF
jgi:hypothetical protein